MRTRLPPRSARAVRRLPATPVETLEPRVLLAGQVAPAITAPAIEPLASTAISAGEAFSLDNTAATHSDLGWDLTFLDHSSVTPGGFETNLAASNFVAPTASTPYFTTTGGVNVPGTTTRQPYLYTTFDDAIPVTAGTPELITMWVGTNGSTSLDVALADGSAAYPATTFSVPTEFQFVVDSATTQNLIVTATPATGVQSGLWAVAASATTTPTPTATVAGSYAGTATQVPAGTDSLYAYRLNLQQSGQSVTGTEVSIANSQPQYFIDYDVAGTVTGDTLTYTDTSVTSVNLPAGFFPVLKTVTLQVSSGGQTLTGPWTGDGYTGEIAATATANTIGGLDLAFGADGLAGHDVGFTATTGVAVDGAASVLVGPTGTSPAESFGITRYNADGSLDTTFGTAGVTTTPFAGTDAVPSAVAVLAGGDILVAGTATFADGVATGSEFAVAEYTASGAPVTGFGTDGQELVGFNPTVNSDVLRALAIGPGGVIYLGGSSDAAGKGNTDLAVVALTPTGSADAAFGTGGTALVDVAGGDDAVNSLAVQANGDLVAAGSATVGGVVEVALARFLPTGRLDPHFGTKGLATDNVGGVYDAAESVVVQPKGQIVIGGLTATGSGASLSSDFLVQRYTAAGRLDRSFGTGGTAVTPFGQPAAVTQLALQSNGDVVASGRTAATLGGPLDVAIARYTTAGKLDATFATAGKVVIDLNLGVVASPSIQVRPAAATALGAAFDAFTASEQGVVAVTAGGAILSAGNDDGDTIEAQLVAAGVDLVAKLLSAVPAAALAGAKGSATVTVTEGGTTKATGAITITVSFAADATGTGAVTAKSLPTKVSLNPGQGKPFKLSFAYPATLPSGDYYLLATVTGGAGLPADLNANNNAAASPAPVDVAAAFVALSGSGLSANAVSPGRSATVSIDLANSGNVTAHGLVVVALYLSTDGQIDDGTQLVTRPVTVDVPAGKSHPYRVTAEVPTSVVAGTYDLLAIVDPTLTLGLIDKTDVSVIVAAALPVPVS